MDKIKVLLADDHTLVRKGLRSLLDGEAGIEIVGEAEDGREAIEKVQESHPDVVLMDITMPGLNGLEATRQIKQRSPQVEVLILTMHANEEYIVQALRAGALGYVVKRSLVAELVSAIRAVHQGNSFLSSSISGKVIEEYIQQADPMMGEDSYGRLTNRERETLRLLAEGHSNRGIAELLHISARTVETYRAHLMGKLRIHNTAGLTRYAIRKGLTSLDQ